MGTLIQGILDNDSFFGRLMTKAGIIIGANLMFILFSIPVVTIGPSLCALYYVMLKTLHGDGVLNPFSEFLKGFKENFRQGMICYLAVVLLGGICYADYRFCLSQGGILTGFRYAVCAIAVIIVAIYAYLVPVMAAFADTIPHLIRNAVYFICQRPLYLPVILFFDIFPLYLTYSDPGYLPLYAFLWCICGFGAIAMIGAAFLYPRFKPHLVKPAPSEEMLPTDPDIDFDEQAMADLRAMDGI